MGDAPSSEAANGGVKRERADGGDGCSLEGAAAPAKVARHAAADDAGQRQRYPVDLAPSLRARFLGVRLAVRTDIVIRRFKPFRLSVVFHATSRTVFRDKQA